MGLAGVLDHGQVMAGSNLQNRIHRGISLVDCSRDTVVVDLEFVLFVFCRRIFSLSRYCFLLILDRLSNSIIQDFLSVKLFLEVFQCDTSGSGTGSRTRRSWLCKYTSLR